MAENSANHLIGLTIGLLADLHISTWGMYKDSIQDGFSYRRYLRTPWIEGYWGFPHSHLLV